MRRARRQSSEVIMQCQAKRFLDKPAQMDYIDYIKSGVKQMTKRDYDEMYSAGYAQGAYDAKRNFNVLVQPSWVAAYKDGYADGYSETKAYMEWDKSALNWEYEP